MFMLVMALLSAQISPECAEATAVLARPDVRELPDVAEAIRRLGPVPGQGCDEVRVAAAYLEGLIAAERAWRAGGSPDALQPMRAIMAELDDFARRGSSTASLAQLVLAAEAAAAQNETSEMGLLLEQALELHLRQRLDGQPDLPVVSVFEAAGDSWLRVYRYREAEQAYTRAAAAGTNPRIETGLQRARLALASGAPR